MSAAPIAGLALSAQAEEEIKKVVQDVCPPADKPKIVRIANALWSDFQQGVRTQCRLKGVSPALEIDPAVFRRGFELSGDFVVRNIERFPDGFPEDLGQEEDPQKTLDCCVVCGAKAVDAALAANKQIIDPMSFEEAWCDTKAKYSSMLKRLLAKQEVVTRTNMTAMGCG